jgi:chromatin remodeling complex protein RSC6
MSATIATDAVVADATKTETSVDSLKTVLQTLTEQCAVVKGLMNTVRQVIKDHDRQSKELEKLRNKRSRVKTERSANSLPSGITKPVAISDELAKFLGVAPGTLVPRNEVTKGVSGFVKEHQLSDPTNKQKFVLDDREHAKQLRVLLGNPSEDVTYFNLQRYLKQHYLPMPGAEPAAPKTPKPAAAPKTPAAAAGGSAKDSKDSKVSKDSEVVADAPAKKKILVKKVKPQLTEETA